MSEAGNLLASSQELDREAEWLYNIYNSTGPNPWLSWNGTPVPRWCDLKASILGDPLAPAGQVMTKWRAVAYDSLKRRAVSASSVNP